MKSKWVKFVSGLVSMIVLTSSAGIQLTHAMDGKNLTNEVELKDIAYNSSKMIVTMPKGIGDAKKEESVYIKSGEESNIKDSNLSGKQAEPVTSSTTENSQYTMADLNKKSYRELIDILSTIKASNITDLFQFSNETIEFYSNSTRMGYLLAALEERGRTFTQNDTKGIPTLSEVIRAGYYLGFYNDGIKSLITRENREKCIPAILAVQKNPNFTLGTAEQDEVIASIGVLINNTSCNVETVNNFMPILKQYDDNIAAFGKDQKKGKAIYNILNGVQYAISGYVYDNTNDYNTSPWNNKIDSFINMMSKWALMPEINKDNDWLTLNCICYIAEIGRVHSDDREGQRVLTEAMKLYPYLSEHNVQASLLLAKKCGSKDYYGNTINIDKIKMDLSNKYLSKQYSFDNGKVIIKAGDRVTEEKIKRLYWASKEVQAQFFRNLGSDKALEQNHADDVLTIVIYNSPDEYKFNKLLNGIDTNNGGMYIEGKGTFYTYERTVNESIYTLEELFRHEFTHYLQGRYLVPGMWGNSALYDDERITWFEEGGAEFFAGSTRTSGILPRKSVVSNIVNRTEYGWYTANRTMHSKYGSFDFYHYGFALQSYMFNKDFVKLYDLMQSVKNNNVTQYDNLIKTFSTDPNLEQSYKKHIKDLVSNFDGLTTPLVEDYYIKNHAKKSELEIFSDITKVAQLNNVKTEVINSQFFDSFKVEGTFNGGKSQGEFNDLKNMDKKMNEFLTTLSGYSWSGYKTVTAYMVDYNVDANNNVTWRVVFHGMLGNATPENNVAPSAVINGPYSSRANESINFTSNGSSDKDGEIVEYLWDFGDNTTSNEANPSHKYEKSGIYNAKLTVKDDMGAIDSKNVEVKILKEKAKPTTINESESNNTFDTANEFKNSSTIVNGDVSDRDKDIFSFEVTSEGTVNINLSNYDNKGITWSIFSASDTKNPFAFPKTRGKELNGTFNAKEGKYYIVVYSYTKGLASYGLKVEGNIGMPEVTDLSEKEGNDSFDLANYIKCNTSVKGNLDGNDTSDIFCFNVENDGDFEIALDKNNSQQGFSWMLYSENDLSKYIAYPNIRRGNKIGGNTKLSKGKYYLRVYKYEGNGDYSVAINAK